MIPCSGAGSAKLADNCFTRRRSRSNMSKVVIELMKSTTLKKRVLFLLGEIVVLVVLIGIVRRM